MRQLSEAIMKEYRECTDLAHIVISTRWIEGLNERRVEECKEETEVFFNRLLKKMLYKYDRKISKTIIYTFWEMKTGRVLHCHCILGWDKERIRRDMPGSLKEIWGRYYGECMKDLRLINRAWLESGEIDEGLIRYCMKESDSDHFASGIDRIRLWKDGTMPRKVAERVHGGQRFSSVVEYAWN